MFSCYKKLFVLFAFIQLLAVQPLVQAETFCTYVGAWTYPSLEKEFNEKLIHITEQAANEKKFFELIEVSVLPGEYSFVLYNLTDREGETNPLIPQISWVRAFWGKGFEENLQARINSLQDDAYTNNKTINFIDIKFLPQLNGFLIFEISK